MSGLAGLPIPCGERGFREPGGAAESELGGRIAGPNLENLTRSGGAFVRGESQDHDVPTVRVELDDDRANQDRNRCDDPAQGPHSLDA